MCNENVTDEHTGFLLSNHDRFGVRDYNGLPPICLKLTVTTKFEICAYPRRSFDVPAFTVILSMDFSYLRVPTCNLTTTHAFIRTITPQFLLVLP